MKSYIITGGAGFIGAHLCRRLLNEGHRVICIDNLITGKKKNIEKLFQNSNFKFLEQDVSEYINVEGDIDYVLHFASNASPKDYSKYPIKTLKAGALGTHNCLGLAKEKNAKFVLASSSEIYGDPEVHPQKESYWGHVNPIGPRGCYDESKRFAESLTMAYHNTHGIKIAILRIFNTYGPLMRKNDGRVIPSFINRALKNAPISIYGNGLQTRSFCYIDDLITGIIKIGNLGKEKVVINLGNPNEITILSLANTILKLTNSKSKIIYEDLPVDDPKKRKPDISKAKKLINYNTTISLKKGLQKTINWFEKTT